VPYFFWLNSSIRFEAHLSDINDELINTYKTLKFRVEELIEALKIYEKEYRQNPLFYYQLRDSAEFSLHDDYVKRAAKFITLNRTCYNGLYRVNRQGKFNVPMGRYKNPTVCNSDNLRNVSDSLRQTEANISVRDYKEFSFNNMGEGDFIYLDPPYSPTSRTSSFTGYTNSGFKDKDQEELANIFKKT
jgi:DNA adenine methylase